MLEHSGQSHVGGGKVEFSLTAVSAQVLSDLDYYLLPYH